MTNTFKPYDTEEHLDYFIFRPLASYIVRTTVSTSITPNQLTIISLILGIFTGFCFYSFEPVSLFIGIMLLFISNVFDCADGQLARARGTGSMAGRIFDGFADNLVFLCIYIAIVLKYQSQSFLLIEGNTTYGWTIWLMAVFAGIGHSLQSSFFDYYRNEYISFVIKGYESEATTVEGIKKELESIKGERQKAFDRLLLRLYILYTALQEKVNKQNCIRNRYHIPQDFDELYKKKNLLLLKAWSLIGQTNHVIYLMIFAAFNRLDLFFFFEVLVLNAYMIGLKLYQNKVSNSIERYLTP